MILINGKTVTKIESTDRGLHYGDGLFETLEIIQGYPVFLIQHLTRLKLGCDVLKIPYPDETLLISEIMQLGYKITHGVLKILLTRGSGGRGYRQPEHISTTRLLALYPFPDYPEHYKTQGIKSFFCATRLSVNPVLAGLKHNNRLEQVLARSEWQEQYQEGLMFNAHEQLIEGTMTNIFMVKDKNLYTPQLKLSGVSGIIRHIIMLLAEKQNIKLIETDIERDFILAADEVFLTNSVIGVWPVALLEERNYQAVGKYTQKMMQFFTDYKSLDLN